MSILVIRWLAGRARYWHFLFRSSPKMRKSRDDCIKDRSVKGCYNGLIKQRYLRAGIGFNETFGNTKSHFHLHRWAEAVTVRDATRAISMTFDRPIEVLQGTHRRNIPGGEKAKLSRKGNGSELIEGRMKCSANRNLAHKSCIQVATTRSAIKTRKAST